VGQTSDKRDALKRWLQERLTRDERGREEWRQLAEAVWDHLLLTPVHDLVDANTAKALADRLAAPEFVSELTRPVMANVMGALIEEMREDAEPVGRFVPEEAKAKLHEVLSRPGLVHPDWVHAMLRGEAVEEVLNDILYRALLDFSTLLPRILVKVSSTRRFSVLGSAGMFAERMIGEVQKLIEPEIRAFLADSTGRVLESAAEFTIANIDNPAQIEFRSSFIDFVLSKSPAFLLMNSDDELLDDMGAVIELTAQHLAEAPETRDAIHRSVDRLMEHCSDKNLGEALQWNDTSPRPPIDALADATWPAYVAAVTSPGAQRFMDGIVDGLIDEYERDASK
jgi:hypothetical protein